MLFRDCPLLSDAERSKVEHTFDIKLSKELVSVPFDDGMHDVPSLKVDFVYDSGRAAMLFDRHWLASGRNSLCPNEVALVWCDARDDCSKWYVKYFPRICKSTMDADKLGADDVFTLATTPAIHAYVFFKDTLLGSISVTHPFVQFAVSKALFTPEELASLQATPPPAAESDFTRFKALFDSVGQPYAEASLAPGDAEQKGYRENVVHGIAMIPPTHNPPRHQRLHWRALDQYTMAFYFDSEGRYVGTCTIPT